MRVLGISAFYHDSAAALVEDGRIVAAAQEERFTRKKFDASYPRLAIDYCLQRRRASSSTDVDHVVFYDKPFIKFERLLETYLAFSPRGFASFRMALPLWLREKLFQKSLLADELKAVEPEFDWAATADLLRASSEPRGLGVLSLAVRARRRADPGRRRRMDDHGGRRSATDKSSRSTRKSIFRTAWACSIPPSPTTPASRSIPANTS